MDYNKEGDNKLFDQKIFFLSIIIIIIPCLIVFIMQEIEYEGGDFHPGWCLIRFFATYYIIVIVTNYMNDYFNIPVPRTPLIYT